MILSQPAEAAFEQAKAAAEDMGWKIKSEDKNAGLIEATATSLWYGFKDDIVIRLRAGEGGGTVVDLRSVSRVGMSDMGANAARIRAFLRKMSEK